MRAHPLVGVLGGALFLLLPHCSGTFSDLCEREKTCEGGNDADVDACVERIRGGEDIASAYDCGDPFDKLIDCLDSKASCVNGKINDDGCKAEEDALESCQKAASGRK